MILPYLLLLLLFLLLALIAMLVARSCADELAAASLPLHAVVSSSLFLATLLAVTDILALWAAAVAAGTILLLLQAFAPQRLFAVAAAPLLAVALRFGDELLLAAVAALLLGALASGALSADPANGWRAGVAARLRSEAPFLLLGLLCAATFLL